MRSRRFIASLLLLALPGGAGAQTSPLSALWREWTTLDAEWRAERSVLERDRERHRDIREAVAAGRDPRATPARPTPRRAGPVYSPSAPEVPR
jgi:hypothetical protein